MNLATWLDQSEPIAVENETLIISFAHEQQQAKSTVERVENRQILSDLLKEVTANLSAIKCTSAAPIMTKEENSTIGLPLAAGVDRDQGKAALENPCVREVVDTFKGRIVDIQAKAPSAEPDPQI